MNREKLKSEKNYELRYGVAQFITLELIEIIRK